jgi:hypothetical protein
MLLQIFYSDHGSTAVEVALKVTSRQSQGPTGGSGEAVARRLEPLPQPPETQWPQTLGPPLGFSEPQRSPRVVSIVLFLRLKSTLNQLPSPAALESWAVSADGQRFVRLAAEA